MAEVTRGGRVESFHRGAFAIIDADGGIVRSGGDIEWPIFPRSAVKLIQALPLVETGAADRYGFGNKELAFAQSSNSGEPGHVAMAEHMLTAAGLTESDLECGGHWPFREEAMVNLAREGGKPNQLHDNCSGKHSGFLCVCRHCGIDHPGYVEPEHEFQAMLREIATDVTGYAHRMEECGRDGCTIPTYPVPLRSLAFGFARVGTGIGLGSQRAAAAKRLMEAGMAEPWYVAGTGRACTRIMEAGRGRIFVKTGAEGVYCGSIPELGVGIALKIDDGTTRAGESAMAGLLVDIIDDEELGGKLRKISIETLYNRRGAAIGEVRPVAISD